jgi:hypothetical protein
MKVIKTAQRMGIAVRIEGSSGTVQKVQTTTRPVCILCHCVAVVSCGPPPAQPVFWVNCAALTRRVVRRRCSTRTWESNISAPAAICLPCGISSRESGVPNLHTHTLPCKSGTLPSYICTTRYLTGRGVRTGITCYIFQRRSRKDRHPSCDIYAVYVWGI